MDFLQESDPNHHLSDLETERRWISLSAWLRNAGGYLHPSLKIERTPERGLSLVASRGSVLSEKEVVKVPTSLCITTENARMRVHDLMGVETEEEKRDADAHFDDKGYITLYLVLHVILGDYLLADPNEEGRPAKRSRSSQPASPHHCLMHTHYTRLLPAQVHVPLNLHPGEVKLLEGTPLYHHTYLRRKESRESCKKAVLWLHARCESWTIMSDWSSMLQDNLIKKRDDLLMDINGDADDEFNDEDGNVDRDDLLFVADDDPKPFFTDVVRQPLLYTWRWAESMQSSRAFPPRLINTTGAPILIPMLDLFNHNRESKVTWFHDVQTRPNVHTVSLKLHYSLGPFQEATNNYGPRPNEELFASYGFVDPSMTDDCAALKLAGGQQYHWRIAERCPEALRAEVKSMIGKNAEFHKDRIKRRMQLEGAEGEAAEIATEAVIVTEELQNMLEEKRRRFYDSEQAYDSEMLLVQLSQRRDIPSERYAGHNRLHVRSEVSGMIKIYREGQKRALNSALLTLEADLRREVSILRAIEEASSEGRTSGEGTDRDV